MNPLIVLGLLGAAGVAAVAMGGAGGVTRIVTSQQLAAFQKATEKTEPPRKLIIVLYPPRDDAEVDQFAAPGVKVVAVSTAAVLGDLSAFPGMEGFDVNRMGATAIRDADTGAQVVAIGTSPPTSKINLAAAMRTAVTDPAVAPGIYAVNDDGRLVASSTGVMDFSPRGHSVAALVRETIRY